MSAFTKLMLAALMFTFGVTGLLVGMVAAFSVGNYLAAGLALAVAAYCSYAFLQYGDRYSRGEG